MNTFRSAIDRCLAVIPARGGSKGISRKNIQLLLGKPLLAYTIEAAQQARSLGRILVSTEDPEIAKIASQFGAEVPFLRPSELARDETPTLPVLQHVLTRLKALENFEPEIIVLLQPTSPLRRASDIDRAVALLQKSGADSVVSLCLAEYSPFWMRRLEGDRVLPFLPDAPEYLRRQDLPPVYQLNGAVYVTRRRVLLEQSRLLGDDTRGIVMDVESSVDIDKPLDWKTAALIMQERQSVGAWH
jgi:N-acylneuraminate cytidylyltransferase/CMP-N,N'-diacetyllegionaminic acid synthase